jgi:outer membrane protein
MHPFEVPDSVGSNNEEEPIHMLRNTILIFAMLLLAAPSAIAQDTTPPKIAVVDIDRVLLQSDLGKKLQEKLQGIADAARGKGEDIANKMRDIQEKLQDGEASLSDSQKSEMGKQFQDYQIQLQRLDDDTKREVQRLQNEGLADIQVKVRPVLSKIQESANYDLILNANNNAVISWTPRVDITKRIIDELNAQK